LLDNLSKMGPEEVIITKAHKGSIIYSKITNSLINIPAVKVKEVNYPTGSGDTFMAAYLSKRLSGSSIIFSANYASKLTSLKLKKDI
jgi:sugar/nucleoside kinase (ribokinase family)